MRKLSLALVAGCMCAMTAGVYAAAGSPADSDKAGRMGPGTAAGQQGATDPSPGKGGAASGKGATTGAGTSGAGAAAGSTTTGAGGASATGGAGMDDTAPRGRRAARAPKG